jgi:hypothetical protein
MNSGVADARHCRAKCQMFRHSGGAFWSRKAERSCPQSVASVSVRARLWQGQCTRSRLDGNRTFEDDRVLERRGHIRYDDTAGEIIANATGVPVPAGWAFLQSSATRPDSSLPAKVGHDPQASLASLSPAPLRSELLHESMSASLSRSCKNGSSPDRNNEEEKNQ